MQSFPRIHIDGNCDEALARVFLELRDSYVTNHYGYILYVISRSPDEPAYLVWGEGNLISSQDALNFCKLFLESATESDTKTLPLKASGKWRWAPSGRLDRLVATASDLMISWTRSTSTDVLLLIASKAGVFLAGASRRSEENPTDEDILDAVRSTFHARGVYL